MTISLTEIIWTASSMPAWTVLDICKMRFNNNKSLLRLPSLQTLPLGFLTDCYLISNKQNSSFLLFLLSNFLSIHCQANHSPLSHYFYMWYTSHSFPVWSELTSIPVAPLIQSYTSRCTTPQTFFSSLTLGNATPYLTFNKPAPVLHWEIRKKEKTLMEKYHLWEITQGKIKMLNKPKKTSGQWKMKWYSLCAAALLLFCEGWGGGGGVHALHVARNRGWCLGGPGPIGRGAGHTIAELWYEVVLHCMCFCMSTAGTRLILVAIYTSKKRRTGLKWAHACTWSHTHMLTYSH